MKTTEYVPYSLEGAPAVGFHKLHDFSMVSVFVIGHQQTLELRDMTFGNDDQALPFGDHIR